MPDKKTYKATPQVVTKFAANVYAALKKFCSDNGLIYDQDAIRLFVAKGLRDAGYLEQTPVDK